MTRRIASLFCLLFVFGQAAGHEFWLNPSTLTPVPGEAFRVGLMHGERFAGDAVPRPASFGRFVVALSDGAEHAVVGMAGRGVSFAKVPAGHAGGGWRRAVLRRHGWRVIALDPADPWLRPAATLAALRLALSGRPGGPGGAAAGRLAG